MSSKKIDRETIPLGLIARSPANPRKTFDEAALQELAESIKLHGVLQPIVVRPIVQRVTRGPLKGASECYELVAGERRVRAAELAGLAEIPATIRELSDQAADQIRLVENDQRADLSPIERADAYGIYLLQHGATVEDLAAAVGKSPSTVRNILRLRNVPQEIRFAVEDGRISASVAGLIARVPGRYHRDTVALCPGRGRRCRVIAVTLKDLRLLKAKIILAMQMAAEMELPTITTITHPLYEAFRHVEIKERRLVKNLRKRGEKRK